MILIGDHAVLGKILGSLGHTADVLTVVRYTVARAVVPHRASVEIDHSRVAEGSASLGEGCELALVDSIVDAIAVRVTITNITHHVAVEVFLAGVGDVDTVVAHITDAVGIRVGLIRIGPVDAVVANVTDTVGIRVGLIRIGYVDAVVADVTDTIEICIGLVLIGYGSAIVTDITETIDVTIGLVHVGYGRAIVIDVQNAIAIRITIDATQHLISQTPRRGRRVTRGTNARR
jgi:hypothetical protein